MILNTTSGAALELHDVHAAYVKKEVLRGVTLNLHAGEVVALLGGNGAGKSTVLKVAAGLLHPQSGFVRLNGEDITCKDVLYRQRQGIGFLLQGGRVFPNLTVRENIEMAKQHSRPQSDLARKSDMGHLFPKLVELATRRAGLLSGGERQMLAIEMVFCQAPAVALLDEPTGALAPDLVKQILFRIKSLAEDRNCAVLLVEQNVAEAQLVSTRFLRLREGVINKEVKENTDEE